MSTTSQNTQSHNSAHRSIPEEQLAIKLLSKRSTNRTTSTVRLQQLFFACQTDRCSLTCRPQELDQRIEIATDRRSGGLPAAWHSPSKLPTHSLDGATCCGINLHQTLVGSNVPAARPRRWPTYLLDTASFMTNTLQTAII